MSDDSFAPPPRRISGAGWSFDLALLALAGYGLALTAEGMAMSGCIPSDLATLIPTLPVQGQHLALLLAVVLHFLVFQFYHSWTGPGGFDASPRRVLARLAAILLFALCLGWSTWANLVSLTWRAKADSLEQAALAMIDGLAARVIDADQAIIVAVTAVERRECDLGEAARQGRDVTGDARCGAICRSHLGRADLVLVRYAELLEPLANHVPTASATLTARYQRLDRALARLAAKDEPYVTFCAEMAGRSCASPSASIATDPRYKEIRRRFEGGEVVDARALVLAKVSDDIAALLVGEVRPGMPVALFFSLAPELLSWFAVALKVVAASRPMSTRRLQREAAALNRQSEALDDLLQKSMTVSGKWRLWRALRRAVGRLDEAVAAR